MRLVRFLKKILYEIQGKLMMARILHGQKKFEQMVNDLDKQEFDDNGNNI